MRCLIIKYFLLVLLAFAYVAGTKGQSLSLDLKTSPRLNFDFNTIDKYINGITVYNVCELNVNVSGMQWDLYVGATTTNAGYWNVNSEYSTTGDYPPLSIVELRVQNSSKTSLVPGFFQLTDIASPTYIIGTGSAPDVAINCSNQGTNQPGDYLASPECYKFRVDMKITPGLNPVYRAGNYELRIDYVLIEDL